MGVCSVSPNLGCPRGGWEARNLSPTGRGCGAPAGCSPGCSPLHRGSSARWTPGRWPGGRAERPGRDRSLRRGLPRPGRGVGRRGAHLVGSPAISGMRVGPKMGRGTAGVCPRSLRSAEPRCSLLKLQSRLWWLCPTPPYGARCVPATAFCTIWSLTLPELGRP